MITRKILIVEDEPSVAVTFEHILKAFRTIDRQTVVIVISAGQDYEIVHDVFKLGADDFSSKQELSNPFFS